MPLLLSSKPEKEVCFVFQLSFWAGFKTMYLKDAFWGHVRVQDLLQQKVQTRLFLSTSPPLFILSNHPPLTAPKPALAPAPSMSTLGARGGAGLSTWAVGKPLQASVWCHVKAIPALRDSGDLSENRQQFLGRLTVLLPRAPAGWLVKVIPGGCYLTHSQVEECSSLDHL